MGKQWSGTSGDVDQETGKLEVTPILGAAYWQPGLKVGGVFVRKFETANGTCNEFMAQNPITVKLDANGRVAAEGKEKKVGRFAMGALTGFEMAIQRLEGFDGFKYGDAILIECTGFQKNDVEGRSDMPTFKIDVSRK